MRDHTRTMAAAAVVLLLTLLATSAPAPTSALSAFNYHMYDTLQFAITAPASMVSNITYTPAVYGASIVNPPGELGIHMEIVLAYPDIKACTDLRGADGIARTVDGRTYEGKIMLILRGDCTFGAKSIFAEQAGAAIALFYSCSPAAPFLCDPNRDQVYSGSDMTNLTTLMIDWWDGSKMANSIQQCYPGADESAIDDDAAIVDAAVASLDAPSACSMFAFIPGTSPISVADRAALTQMSTDMVFDFMIDGTGQSGPLPPFSAITNTSLDVCLHRVAGVWCVGDPGRVVILDLDTMNITGILSSGIGDLTALQQLTLNDNNFWCTALHCSFGNLTSLRVMNLFHMGLQAFQPPNMTCLDPLVNLLAVNAAYNQIAELTPSMEKWHKIRALNVANNQITSTLTQVSLSVFQDLEYLNMANNDIYLNVDNISFTSLSKMQYLYMGSNYLSGRVGFNSFDNLSLLLEVDLSDNNMDGRLPAFYNTHNLVHVDFSDNFFDGNCTAWFMPSLTYLSLAGNLLAEPLEQFPTRFQSLSFLDVSNNYLTIDNSIWSDVGAYLYSILPISIETVHLENNSFAGNWGPGFLTTFGFLAHFYMSNNLLTAIPHDLFEIGGSDTLIDLDLSFNMLHGVLPDLPPSPVIASVKFNGNPGLVSPTRSLPSWAMIDPQGSFVQPLYSDSYACPSLIGTSYHLSVVIDPSYFGYQGCQCNRGTYGVAPNCMDIPTSMGDLADVAGQGTFTDSIFGNKRFFVGVDTTFILARSNITTTLDSEGRRRHMAQAVQESGFDVPASASRLTVHMTDDETSSSFHDSSSNNLTFPNPPAPEPFFGVVRAIYLTIVLNTSIFLGVDESLSVYAGGLDLRGARVAFWQGTDRTFGSNIDLQGMYPSGTLTILASQAVVNFRSRQQAGSHFVANFTLSSECPPGYLVTIDDVDPVLAAVGRCALPPQTSTSATVVLLLVTSVIIGMLALCLLGNRMSTIQGLINGDSLHNAQRGLDNNEQAQELYGPVLSVEEAWRRQLKRDIVKEGLMLGLEVAGYASNWLVVLEELAHRTGSVLADKFLVVYMVVVVASTITGSLSVFARVRVMKEIYRELKVGLAVVPSIDTLLHHARHIKEGKSKRLAEESSRSYVRQQQQHQQNLRQSQSQSLSGFGTPVLPPSKSTRIGGAGGNGRASVHGGSSDDLGASFDCSTSFPSSSSHQQLGPSNASVNRGGSGKGALSKTFGRPLLSDTTSLQAPLLGGVASSPPIDSEDFEQCMDVDSEHSLNQATARAGDRHQQLNHAHHQAANAHNPSRPISGASHHSTNTGSGASGFHRSSTSSSDPEVSSASSGSNGEHEVRLSSKDPNVQLAWVQRTISTTKLTSFNLIFSTLPFLVLNQVRIFKNNTINQDWAMQLSSLFATMLLGVKLLRILALGELIQRRNELVFEVIIAGTSKASMGLGGGGGGGDKDQQQQQQQQQPYVRRDSIYNRNGGGYSPAIGSRSYSIAKPAPVLPSGGGGGVPGAHLAIGPIGPGGASYALAPGLTLPPSASGGLLGAGGPPSDPSLSPSPADSGDGEDCVDLHASLPGIAPQSLMAPAGSLVTSEFDEDPFSGSSFGAPTITVDGEGDHGGGGGERSPAGAHHPLFAPSASFSSFQPLAKDDASLWAKENRGSMLIMQPQHQQNCQQQQPQQHHSLYEDAAPAPVSSASPALPPSPDSSSSSSDVSSSRTVSASDSASGSSSWIARHMLNGGSNGVEAACMEKIKSQQR